MSGQATNQQAKLLQKLLLLLETRLQQAGEWQVPLPEAAAFETETPFAVDTMSLPQWLRYVFMPRLQALIDSGNPLPGQCAVTPQVDMVIDPYKKARIMEVTQAIDALLTDHRVPAAQLLKQV